MINMNMQYFQRMCDCIHEAFCTAYPNHKWAVLPEVEGSSGSMGFYIATMSNYFYTNEGERVEVPKECAVVSRPHVRITTPEKLEAYYHDPEILMAAFERILTGSEVRFGSKRQDLSYILSSEACQTPIHIKE